MSERDLEYLRSELPSDFDPSIYLEINKDLRDAGVDPIEHYLLHGNGEGRQYKIELHSQNKSQKYSKNFLSNITRGIRRIINSKQAILPDDFNSIGYLELNPDLKLAGVDPELHYISHGAHEGRRYSLVGAYTINEISCTNRTLKTILLISHEATRTGAPILSLSLIDCLSKKYNVVVLLLSGGVLNSNFLQSSATSVILADTRGNPFLAEKILDEIAFKYIFHFSLVNSLEASLHVLKGLSNNFIPAINLVHEYSSCYCRSLDVLKYLCSWPGEIVFSSQSTLSDAVNIFPDILSKKIHVIPQGRSNIPRELNEALLQKDDIEVLKNLIRPYKLKNETVIIGAGPVCIRKGPDLFIQVAAQVIKLCPDKNFRFVWIGKRLDEEIDLSYTTFVKDQIVRSGLKDSVVLIDETPYLEVAYQEADLFLVSSRLDPLPNVAIDAMSWGIPVLCFDKCTGIAEILIDENLEEECVANYLDVTHLASKIIKYSYSNELIARVGDVSMRIAHDYFQIENYSERLSNIGELYVDRNSRSLEIISLSEKFNQSYYLAEEKNCIDQSLAIQKYIQEWGFGMTGRKPSPDFHPGIYRELNNLQKDSIDPFAHYLASGCPTGAWKSNLIIGDRSFSVERKISSNFKSLLHIHVYYLSMLGEILSRLKLNSAAPDLFITVTNPENIEPIQSALKNYCGELLNIKVVPNAGRDIAPFLIEALSIDLTKYEYIGHVHTKKSTHVSDVIGAQWSSFLYENTIGGEKSGAMMDRIFNSFGDDKGLGLIYPSDPNACGWDLNLSYALDLAKKLNIRKLPNNFNFPIGNMFWGRVSVFARFKELNFDWSECPSEPLPIDGTVLHAIERIIPHVIASSGYEYALTYTPGVTR
jgi:glycosyltransferase involved in cell wall biosynthesis